MTDMTQNELVALAAVLARGPVDYEDGIQVEAYGVLEAYLERRGAMALQNEFRPVYGRPVIPKYDNESDTFLNDFLP